MMAGLWQPFDFPLSFGRDDWSCWRYLRLCGTKENVAYSDLSLITLNWFSDISQAADFDLDLSELLLLTGHLKLRESTQPNPPRPFLLLVLLPHRSTFIYILEYFSVLATY